MLKDAFFLSLAAFTVCIRVHYSVVYLMFRLTENAQHIIGNCEVPAIGKKLTPHELFTKLKFTITQLP
jgi:hypothetical protein